jgi:hypothetical protein
MNRHLMTINLWLYVRSSKIDSRAVRYRHSRNRVAENITFVDVYKYIAQFFRHVYTETVNKQRPWVTKPQWFAIQNPFWIMI